MSKFTIACPSCGSYAEARTGFFARKKIDCACGYTINVRTDKLIGRECPHCGNMVVFDQSKGRKALCPVCKEPINTIDEQSHMEEFSCVQCGVHLRTDKAATVFVCPVCDFENDVPERLAFEKIRKDGVASVIKYEGDNETLVWKYPIEDFNMGSQLIVHESQEAIFFRDGQALDLFGAGRYTLETQRLPLLEKLYHLPIGNEGTFHSEVYYINMATQMGVKWGTDSKVRLFDPASGLHIEIGASGEFNIRVTDPRKLLLKVVGTAGRLGQAELLNGKGAFRALVMTQVKSYLAQTIKDSGISILEIDAHLMTLSQALRERINEGLADYGLTMPEFFISRVATPDDDRNYQRMKEQFAEQYLGVRQEQINKSIAEAAAERKAVEEQTAARIKIIEAQGDAEKQIIDARGDSEALKMRKFAETEAYRAQAAAEAEEMRIKGYTYQQETARQVGLEAMKNGIGGEGGILGGIGDLAGLGIGLGTMSSVIDMTKDALRPLTDQTSQSIQNGQVAQNAASITNPVIVPISPLVSMADAWDCSCGEKGLVGKFCPECGAKRPQSDTWDCSCGQKGMTGKFCPECGKKRGE